MIQTDVLKVAQGYVEELYAKKDSTIWHGLQHTQAVVSAAEKIGQENSLNPDEMKILLLAAWLHDIGSSEAKNTFEASARLAAEFLTEQEIPPTESKQVIRCMQAASAPQNPQTTLEAVFCDALTSIFALTNYPELVAAYTAKRAGENADKAEWLKKQKTLLADQVFFTNYARQTYSAGKERNAELLNKMRKQLKQELKHQEEAKKEIKKLRKEEEKEKEKKAGRGIETLFRTTMASHLQLSVMADNKANLMISINAIIASIMVSSFLRRFEEVPELMIPTLCLTLVCILTIVFAVMATRPNIKTHLMKEEKTDMLFFGHFSHLSADSYKEGIRQIMRNNDLLYNSMIDNIYSQGKVLTKKYRLLKISYTIFMYGFAIVLIGYAVALLLLPAEK